jgi:hypothetical protein
MGRVELRPEHVGLEAQDRRRSTAHSAAPGFQLLRLKTASLLSVPIKLWDTFPNIFFRRGRRTG